MSKKDKVEKERRQARLKEVKARLREETKNEIKPIAIGTIAMVCSSVANQALPRFLGKVLDQSSKSPNNVKASPSTYSSSTVNSLALIVIGGGISSFLRTIMLTRAQDSIASRLRSNLFSKLMMSQYSANGNESKVIMDEQTSKGGEKPSTSSQESTNSPTILTSILTNDINILSQTITTTLANSIRSSCSVLLSTFNMFTLNPQLLSLSISIVPIIGSAAVILNKFIKKMKAQQHKIDMQATTFAQERLEKVDTVKLSSREESEIQAYDELQRKALEMAKRVTLARGSFMGFIFMATSSALVLVFQAGGKAVHMGKMTHGELKSFVAYTFLLGLGTSGLMKGLGEMSQGYLSAERVYQLMDEKDSCCNDELDGATSGKETINVNDVQAISVTDTSFSYTSDETTKVLKNISFKIQRGEVVALVGKNGSGKSTLASILTALYKPQSGKVNISHSDGGKGIDFYSLDRNTQSQLIQLVPQNSALFELSILDNVTYAKPSATKEEVKKALTLSNADGFISNLKGGLNYNVGRNGCHLSGGQKQRITIARALLSNSPLLILDEPLKSLDADGELAVSDLIRTCRNDDGSNRRGLVLITHRVASLRLVDRIDVLKDGVIAESGTYEELSKNTESELSKLMSDLQ